MFLLVWECPVSYATVEGSFRGQVVPGSVPHIVTFRPERFAHTFAFLGKRAGLKRFTFSALSRGRRHRASQGQIPAKLRGAAQPPVGRDTGAAVIVPQSPLRAFVPSLLMHF